MNSLLPRVGPGIAGARSFFVCVAAACFLAAAPSLRAALPAVTLLSPPATQVGTYVGTSSFPIRFAIESDTPYTEVWYKSEIEGPIVQSTKYSLLAGELRIRNIEFADEGHYYLEVTNASGTTRSVTVWLIVMEVPPAPVIVEHPQSVALAFGSELMLGVTLQSHGSYQFRWYKNGTAIPGAFYSQYYVGTVSKADAGSYHVVISSPTASATSNQAVVTVADPIKPSITVQPQDVSMQHGGSSGISVEATGSPPLLFRLYRGTALVAEQSWNNFWLTDATQAETAGVYHVEVSNPAGSVNSRDFTVTVSAPVPPEVSVYMTGTTVSVGGSFSLSGNVTGSQPMVVQWYKDGVPLKEGNSSSAWISNATPDHAGTYVLKATNAGGTDVSDNVIVTVTPPQPPAIQSYSNGSQVVTYVGNYLSLSYANVTGTGPLTYTWFKDGQQIGEGWSSYSKSSATMDDEGMYWLEVTSPYGSATGEPFYVQVQASSYGNETPAQHAVHAGIVYVVAPNSSILRRYNLSTGTWSDPVSLGFVPRGFAVNEHAIFAGNGRALQRFSLSVDTPVNFKNYSGDIREIICGAQFLFVAAGDYVYPVIESLDYATGAVKGTTTTTYGMAQHLVLNADNTLMAGRDMGLSPSDIYRLVVNADGSFGATLSSPYHGDYAVGTRLYFAAGGTQVVENSGIVYNATDLKYAKSWGGPFSDMIELEGGRVVVTRGRRAVIYEGGVPGSFHDFAQAGSFMVRDGSRLISFSISSAGNVAAESVELADIDDAAPLMQLQQPAGRKFRPADVACVDDLLFMHDRSAGNVHVFDVAAFQYTDSIALRGRPTFFRLDATTGSMFTAYSDGSVWRLDDSTSLLEKYITMLPSSPHALVPLGNRIFMNDASGAWSSDYVFDVASGALLSSKEWAYHGADYIWSPVRSRVYFMSSNVSPSDIHYVTINTDGTIGTTGDSPYHGNIALGNPLRINPAEGLLLTGSGALFDAVTLAQAGALGNAFVDAVWTSSTIASIRADTDQTEIQLWSPNSLTLTASAKISGEPLRIFSLSGGRFLVLGLIDGVPSPTIVNADLSVANRLLPLSPDLVAALPERVVALGTSVVLDAFPHGGPAGSAFTWKRDGTVIAGQTSRLLDLGTLEDTETGLYSVTATFGGESITSNPFWVGPEPELAFLSNVSTRSFTEGGNRILVMGFVLDGAGSKPLLMRTAGPALTGFGLTGALADPVMRIYRGQEQILVNDNWQDPVEYLATGRRANQLGAFGFQNLSGDAALLPAFQPGAYTIHADSSSIGESGIVLAEIYDANTPRERLAAPRIANFSARCEVRPGEGVLVLGFVVDGNAPLRLLVRGVGPTLSTMGVEGALPDATIAVIKDGVVIAQNDNWGGTSELTTTFSQLGAFPLPANSLDAAVIITIQPGIYTAVVSGKGDASGIAIAELYRID